MGHQTKHPKRPWQEYSRQPKEEGVRQDECNGKRRYTNENEAIKMTIQSSREFGHAMRYYYCTKCDGYHLTSKPKRRKQSGKR